MIDQVTINRLRQKDQRALEELVDQYTGYVTAILCNLARGTLTAEDIEETAADVFLKLWNSAENLDPERPLKPYLAQMTRNTLFSRLRRTDRARVPLDEDLLLFSSGPQPAELAEQREQAEIVGRTVEELGEPEKEIFVRYYYFGERLCAIAGRLGLNQATARTKLRRCRQRLQKVFNERGYGCEEDLA